MQIKRIQNNFSFGAEHHGGTGALISYVNQYGRLKNWELRISKWRNWLFFLYISQFCISFCKHVPYDALSSHQISCMKNCVPATVIYRSENYTLLFQFVFLVRLLKSGQDFAVLTIEMLASCRF